MDAITDNRFTFRVSRQWEIVLFVLLFGMAIFLRFYNLSADPPADITLSTGIETDPPQYTVYARSDVLTGEWNNHDDNRHVTYQYSVVSLLGRVIFGSFGIGAYQANLVGVVLSMLSIFLFYLVLRKALGNGVALLALFFIGFNFIGIFYGRRPFLENGMISLFVLALFFLTYMEERLSGHFLFGLFTAAAIVFGKIIALAFLGVPVVYYTYKILALRIRSGYSQMTAMIAGFVTMSVGWYLFVFAPNARSVYGYAEEQVLGLYGYPEAFTSLSKFVWKFLVFGIQTEFFDRLPVISIGGLIFLAILGSYLITNHGAGSSRGRNLILVSIAAWLVAIYLAEMPWNYQPLRYQTVMIFPLGGLTAVLMAYIYNLKDRINLLNRSIVFNVVLFVLLLLLAYQVTRAIVVGQGGDFNFRDYFSFILAMILLLCFIYFMISYRKEAIPIRVPRYFRCVAIVLALIISLYYQANYYLAWAGRPLYTSQQASRDLGMILSPGAVVSGPYGPALTLDNDLGCIIHVFGTSRPDPSLFSRFPVTHLALDYANEMVARRIYPEILKQATLISNYNINCNRVSIYNIAPHTGNLQAATYSPSIFEKAVSFLSLNQIDSANYYLDHFLRRQPNNISGYTRAGIYALETGNFRNAVNNFSRAVDFSYTDFNLHFFLGNAYIGLADSTGDESFRELAEAEINLARRYSLGKFDLDDYIIKSPKDRENGNTGKK